MGILASLEHNSIIFFPPRLRPPNWSWAGDPQQCSTVQGLRECPVRDASGAREALMETVKKTEFYLGKEVFRVWFFLV